MDKKKDSKIEVVTTAEGAELKTEVLILNRDEM